LEYLSTLLTKWTKEFEQEVRQAGKEDTAYQQAMEDLSRSMQKTEGKEELLQLQDRLLYCKGLLWVPENSGNVILHTEHDSRVAGHFGQDKRIELIRHNFWLPKMDQQIIDYVRSCLQCQKDKAARHKPYGLLLALELPYALWTSIAMAVIMDLPLSEDCNQLRVIVVRFTKMANFIPLRRDQKKAAHLVKIFAREIWRFHGIPTDIISDRDSRFTSTEWKQFLGILGIRTRMSTSFHPQTNGQIERINQTIEAYLTSFINYEMDNWVGLLPMAEFAYNNSITQATRMSLFYANYG
jgi:cytochrome b